MGLAIPVGLTLGVLLAFRKLALSSELDSLRAVGLSYGRLLRVPFLYAIALLGLNFFIVGYVQPQAQYEYQSLRHELRSGALGASIKVGEFTDLGRRMTLRVERSENGGTDLHGVFLHLAAEPRADGDRERGARHLPRHRRSRHHTAAADQRPAGPQRARLSGAARAELRPAGSADRPADDRGVPRARRRHQGDDGRRIAAHRARTRGRRSTGATRRSPISISAWSRC